MLFMLFLIVLPAQAEPYQIFEEKGKVGIKDDQGQIVIPPSFEALGWSDGSFSVIGLTTGYRINEHWGLINLKKEFITPAIFESLIYAGGDHVIARKKLNAAVTKSGCISLHGAIKLPFSYDGIKVHGLRAIVFNLIGAKFKYGLADMQNNILIPITFNDIYPLGTLRFAVENQLGRIALFSDLGKPITEFRIDSLSNYYKNFSTIYENGLEGLIDRDGEIKLATRYRSIKITEEGTILAQLPGEWSYLNDKNEVISKWMADDLLPTSSKLNIILLGGKYGLIDQQQNSVIPIQFDRIQEVQPGKFLAKKMGKWGLFNSYNRTRIPFDYDSIQFLPNCSRAFIKYKGWQLIDSIGNIKTKKQYDYLADFDGTSFVVRSKGYWGLVDFFGDEIIHCVFDSITERHLNRVAVKFKGQFGIMDLHENWKLAPQPYPIKLVNDDRYVLQQRSNSFLKNYMHQIIYFTTYNMRFKEDYWLEILHDGIEKPISYDGLVLKGLKFPDDQAMSRIEETHTGQIKNAAFVMSEGLMGIRKDGKFGFVDTNGKLRIANRYDSIGDFHEGLAPIKLIGMWGFINQHDKIVIQPNYQSVTRFSNSLSRVKRNDKYGLINKEGDIRLALRYDELKPLANHHYMLKMNQRFGVANEKGEVDIETRFDFLEDLNNGLLIAGREGRYGLITNKGLDRIPMIYGKLIFDKARNLYLTLQASEWKVMKL